MSVRAPKIDTIKAARAKEKRQRRKPAEDRTPVAPIIIKSPSRRYERRMGYAAAYIRWMERNVKP